jgi:hypothetical protein
MNSAMLRPVIAGCRLSLTSALACVALLAVVERAEASGLLQWLGTPVSGALDHEVSAGVAWHGRLMVLAWGLLAPAGLVIARYFKVVPGQNWPARLDNPFWFITHRRIGSAAAAATLLALIAILWSSGWRFIFTGSLHAMLGWLLVVLTVLQIVGALLRGTHGGPMNPFTRQPKPESEWPGDHFSMTRRRIIFEYSHKALGYLAILLSVLVLFLGLGEADAPRWMWLGLGLWWLAVLVTLVVLQTRVGCIDTYQAIWGLDRSLPGYRRAPIGIGITQLTAADLDGIPWRQRRAPKDQP